MNLIGVDHKYSNIHAVFKEIDLKMKRAQKGKKVRIGVEALGSEYAAAPKNAIGFWKNAIDYAKTYPNAEIVYLDSAIGRSFAEKLFTGKLAKGTKEWKKAAYVADMLRSKYIGNRITKQRVDMALVGANHAAEIAKHHKMPTKFIGAKRTDVINRLRQFRKPYQALITSRTKMALARKRFIATARAKPKQIARKARR